MFQFTRPALFALLLMLTSSLSFAHGLTERQRLRDLDQFFDHLEYNYGPLRFKERKLGITLAGLRAKYEPLAKAAKTNGEFFYLINRLVSEFRDGHFHAMIDGIQRYSYFPLTTDLVDGAVLIDQQLGASVLGLERGDEVVSFNGRPVGEELDRIQAYISSGYERSARRQAAMSLFRRAAAIMPAPEGDFQIGIRRKGSQRVETLNASWFTLGDALDLDVPTVTPISTPARLRLNLDLLSQKEHLERLFGRQRLEQSFRCSGKTRIKIPDDAIVLREEPFVAYYHPTPKGNIGYLRIPDYMPITADGQPDFKERFDQYADAINIFEDQTVGLIIDQDHNCGGSVDYMQQLVGLFMQGPYRSLEFSLVSNKENVLEMRTPLLHAGIDPDHDELDDPIMGPWLEISRLLTKHWRAGDLMTEKTPLSGAKWLKPVPKPYSKPIIVLIDELSGSCGDAFPAMLQGFGRAKLLGTRTAGLGGHLGQAPTLLYSRISMSYTKSLFYRPDGVEVENNGAVPDIPYSITREDFVNGYQEYQKFYLKALLDQVKPPTP